MQDNDFILKNKKPKSKKLKIFLIILAAILVLVLSLGVFVTVYIRINFKYNYNEIPNQPEELGFEEELSDEIINIALFGVDTNDKTSFKGRSDSIMILSINTDAKTVKLISVLRDSFVPIEKKGTTVYSKINDAYASGGPELAIRTLNSVFALDISEYATVNFSGMAEIIDAMDGIEANITDSELSHINQTIHSQAAKYGGEALDYKLKESGYIHLNGIQAVAYARIRYVSNADGTSNDYGRTDRQRYILGQLFNKAKTLKLSKIVELLKALSPCVETSLSYSESINLAAKVLINSPTMEETRVPFTEYIMTAPKTSSGSIVYYDLNFAANIIHAFIYDGITPEEYISIKGIQQNDWYANGYYPPVIEQVSVEDNAVNSQEVQ